MDDEKLRRRQRRAEAARDRWWDEKRRIYEQHKAAGDLGPFISHEDRLAIFDQAAIEVGLAERLLRDGTDQESAVTIILAMRHSLDPHFVITEADEYQARASVEIAQLKISGKLDGPEDDEETDP